MYNWTTIGHGLGYTTPSKILAWGLGSPSGVVTIFWAYAKFNSKYFPLSGFISRLKKVPTQWR